jgi:hypothetical protein
VDDAHRNAHHSRRPLATGRCGEPHFPGPGTAPPDTRNFGISDASGTYEFGLARVDRLRGGDRDIWLPPTSIWRNSVRIVGLPLAEQLPAPDAANFRYACVEDAPDGGAARHAHTQRPRHRLDRGPDSRLGSQGFAAVCGSICCPEEHQSGAAATAPTAADRASAPAAEANHDTGWLARRVPPRSMPEIANDDVQLANHLGPAVAWEFLREFLQPRLSS